MKIIGSKAEAKKLIELTFDHAYNTGGPLIEAIHTFILKKKIRFPILEFISSELYTIIPKKEQLYFMDEIITLNEIGGNVIAGFLLQLRLEKHFTESIHKAIAYIIYGDKWYVCDIIGERVMGHALLTQPVKTVPLLKRLSKHSDKWIVRSVGVATHYAVKKGLKKGYSERMFQILLSCANTTDFHTKKGIGWAAKTIAKFHPDIIQKNKMFIDENPEVKQWFKTKIKTGLSRSFKYASGNTGKIHT